MMKNLLNFYLVVLFVLPWCESIFFPNLFRQGVCYSAQGHELGCFNKTEPWEDLPLPWSPNIIQPRFNLFTRTSNDEKNPVRMDLDLPIPPEFDPNLKTKIIIHGFLGSAHAPWMHRMKDELLIEGDHNVILVGWSRGAQVINYNNAASNIRVVSAYLAKLLDLVSEQTGHEMSNVHCIGHSLGAQTCGFTGKRVSSPFARISGLDPAGPHFRNEVKEARLDESDADFVDIIHSNGKDHFIIDLGIGHQSGDVDFIPNGGGVQPGCVSRRKRSWDFENANAQKYLDEILGLHSCSHSRSYRYFTESINSDCPFTAVPCKSMEALSHGDCESCEGDECQVMGYHADKRPGRGIFFLETNSNSPFCID